MPTHEYPPERWRAEEIAGAIRDGSDDISIPRYEDEDFWTSLGGDDQTVPAVDAILDLAETAAEEPIPPLRASHYLRWLREDDITQPEIRAPLSERLDRLSALALAECIHRDGRYADDILDFGWAICEQSQWSQGPNVLSASRNREGLPIEVPPEERRLALRTMMVGKTLAHLDHVLGDRLHPALRKRIRKEVDRRIFEPFEARDDLWWMSPPTNNWNAAQNGGAIVAALFLLDDPDRVGRIVEKAAGNMQYYLESFDADGCTAEGVGYWNFGFGNYVTTGAYLEARSGGALSLFSPPVVREIAEYPLKVELSPGRFLPFSDSLEESSVDPATACFLGRRFDLPRLAARGRQAFDTGQPPVRLGKAIRSLAWCRSVSQDADWNRAESTYFDGFDWWIGRDRGDDPDSLVVAAKGGHNDEPHNHNDCGSVVVHYRGESLVTDLGKPPQGYPDDFFDEGRYERYLLLRSLGHSVPVVDGTEQAAGEEYAATVLGRTGEDGLERFALELADCYPVEGLRSLRREISLDRGSPGRVSIEDSVEFSDGNDHEVQTVLVSYFPMERGGEALLIEGNRGRARVAADPETELRIERIENGVDERDVWRARFDIPISGGEGALDLSIEVASSDDQSS